MKKLFHKALATVCIASMLAQPVTPLTGNFMDKAKAATVEQNETKDLYKNPTIEGPYADPEMHIYGDQFWVFPTYDNWSYEAQMNFDCFSSKDMKTWTKYESILDMSTFDGIWRAVWAPTQIEKNGKYYILFGANDLQYNGDKGGFYMGVADKPQGPYRNVRKDKQPILDTIENGAQPIDAHMFKDDDGTIYIYYGGWRHCNVGILNDTMDGFIPVEDPGPLDPNAQENNKFVKSTVFKELSLHEYVEGPFMIKRNGTYYLMYSTGGWTNSSYGIEYATADNPFGPFTSQGKIMATDYAITRSAGHHSAVYDKEHDQWLICYHRRRLMKEEDNGAGLRSVCIDKMDFDKDGKILPIRMTYNWDWIEQNEINIQNLARNKECTYFARTVEGDNYGPEKAFDGMIASDSRWAQQGGTGGGQYLGVCFGKKKTFNHIYLKFQRLGFWDFLDGNMKFQISNDGDTWEDISETREWTPEECEKKGSNYDNIELYKVNEYFDKPVTARYVRVYFPKETSINSIYEFEVYDHSQNDKTEQLKLCREAAAKYTNAELAKTKYKKADVLAYKQAFVELRQAVRDYTVTTEEAGTVATKFKTVVATLEKNANAPTVVKPTPKPVVVPAKGVIKKLSNVKGKKVVVTFKKLSKVKKYQIRYALKSNMKKAKTVTVAAKKQSCTVKGLKAKKTYYFQIRALGTSGKYGKWSNKKQIKIKK
ncbi:MAG: family 43 glycosylhydrolase [Lachnospiraceae bacterium]|nr:family 43 glycosylhydrolase [Lachnospiraceae bacterium]